MRNKTEMRGYQDRFATYLYEHDDALCIARPGGGKTAAALTAFAELHRDGIVRRAIVVAPKRVAHNVWPEELRTWTHMAQISMQLLVGTPAHRAAILRNSKADLLVIGIDLIDWLMEQLLELPADDPLFDLLIIDEISKLRSPTGVRSKLVAKHASLWKMVWGLTGTLRPNGPEDMFMPARIVSRGALWGKSFYQWRQKNFYPTDFNGYNWDPLPGREQQLNDEIAPYTVTMSEAEYPQMPALSVVFDRIALPSKAQNAYDDMHRKLMLKYAGKDVVAVNSAVATGKLAQIANGFVYDAVNDKVVSTEIHDEKYNWLADIIDNATGPTLLIYEYKHDLTVMQELLPNLPYLGEGVSDTESKRNIEMWNKGLLPFMGLHPASGGHGLNLQHGGCDMAWIAPCWSAELWEQTIARLARPGQSKPVVVRVCVARGTVDEMKLLRVHHKVEAQKAFEMYIHGFASRRKTV